MPTRALKHFLHRYENKTRMREGKNLLLGERLALHELRNLLVDVTMRVAGGRHRPRHAHLLHPFRRTSRDDREVVSSLPRKTLTLELLRALPRRSPLQATPAAAQKGRGRGEKSYDNIKDRSPERRTSLHKCSYSHPFLHIFTPLIRHPT